VRVVCISDTHLETNLVIPDGDLLIHAGDALSRGTFDELLQFNTWLGTLPHKHKVYVPGNHDIYVEAFPEIARKALTNATMLIDEEVNIEGLRIYGSPWTPTFYDWAFMKPDIKLAHVWHNIPENLDILITHGPPYSILDKNSRGDLCGSKTLYKAVKDKSPKFHIFGHIHHSSGIERIEDTMFINAAVLDDRYDNSFDAKIFCTRQGINYHQSHCFIP